MLIFLKPFQSKEIMSTDQKVKILIVEDEPTIALYEKILFIRNGYDVVGIAESSTAALLAVEKHAPDIIIMDILLKGIGDGIDTAEVINKDHDIPVIFLSAIEDSDNLARIRNVRSYGYLGKPIREYELLVAVETAVELHKLYQLKRLNEQKYRFIFENMQDVYYECTMDGFLLEVSPSVKHVFGYLRNEVIGKSIYDFLSNKNDAVAFFAMALREKKGLLKDIGIKNKNGDIHFCDNRFRTAVDESGKPVKIVGSINDITARKDTEDTIRNAHQEVEALLLSMNTILIGVSLRDVITHWNRESELVFGLKETDVLGKKMTNIPIHWEWSRIYEGIAKAVCDGGLVNIQELRYSKENDGEMTRYLNIKITPIINANNELRGFMLSGDDITENRTLRMRSNQSQKLESIGQLASGVAHEINTPTQYINDNTIFLKNAFEKVLSYANSGKNCIPEEFRNDFAFYADEVPKAIEQTLEGIGRISKIVSSMKQFSHPGTQQKIPYDINKIIDDVVTITRNEWKYVSEMELVLDETLPTIKCFPNAISQVLLNIIVNAAQSINSRYGAENGIKGLIKVETWLKDQNVEIIISDNGIGMSEKVKEKIFDPFFTTKEIGKGTGQGLAIAFSVINDMHGGTIAVESEPDKGAVFIISLPSDQKAEIAANNEI
jgi:PAS domain S-box-containing protein